MRPSTATSALTTCQGTWPSGEGSKRVSKGFLSPLPRLYAFVNEKLFSKPTYASFIRLLDNYQRATGREEEVTAEELREQDTFLREVMKTELMKKLFVFLHNKSECGAWEERGPRVSIPQLLFPCLPPRSALPADRYGSEQEFLEDLKEMWFGLYSRGNGEKDSSGFEHVFSGRAGASRWAGVRGWAAGGTRLTPGSRLCLGEVKKGQVSGFHNWIRFYLLEKQGLVNYYSHNYNGPVSAATMGGFGQGALTSLHQLLPEGGKWGPPRCMGQRCSPLCPPTWTLGWKQGGEIWGRWLQRAKEAPRQEQE